MLLLVFFFLSMLTRTITGLMRRYEDILEPKDIYSLIALTAYHNKYYGICSRAFISKFERAELFVRCFRFYSLKHFDSNVTVSTCLIQLTELETMPQLSDKDRDTIQNLALQIFTKNQPLDPEPRLQHQYLDCLDTGTPYHACTSSGRLVHNDGSGRDSRAIVCRTCRYSAYERELERYSNCPLCHSPLEVMFGAVREEDEDEDDD